AKQYTEPENNKVQEYTTVIQESTQRMVEMIQHMIALSKADAQVTLQPVDLNNLLAEVKSMLAIIIAHNNAEVLYGKLPVIKSNRTLLSQILQNLIVNAIKYNNSNRPTVEIVYFKHNNKHWFEVHDNGIGIPEEKREKIFFIFSRLHQEEVSGTGIGLAVCKKAVELLNGKIWAADSRLGGACIKFSIPVETELNFSLKNT
ncbi:MAG TPA: HAMP domain-containing sensor histidine kinase, partial [Chitinophagales bacterium]|nr:HAMP domain-containing sensor histidine kinase [Chitinophagales bacterium]